MELRIRWNRILELGIGCWGNKYELPCTLARGLGGSLILGL